MKKTFIKKKGIFIVLYFLLAMILAKELWTSIDNDFFHIVVSGRDILRDYHTLYHNIHFIKDGYDTLLQQWLYAIIVYQVSKCGSIGIKLFGMLQYFLLLAIGSYYLYLKSHKASFLTALYASLLIPLCISEQCFNIRPEMISFILFLLQLIIIEKYRQSKKAFWLYFLPLLVLLEVNLHLSFGIFHFILLFPFITPFPNKIIKIKSDNIFLKPLILPVILMAVAMFVNPYTYKSYLFLLLSRNVEKLQINELQPALLLSMPFFIGLILFLFCIKKQILKSSAIYLFLGTFLMYGMADRNILFFALTIVYLSGELLNTCSNADIFWKWFSKKTATIICAGVVILCVIVLFSTHKTAKETKGYGNELCPTLALSYLQENEEDLSKLRIFTGFNNGSFFLYYGIGHVYIEPKTEPYLKSINHQKDIVSEFSFLVNYASGSEFQDFLNEYDFDYLLTDSLTTNLDTYLSCQSDYICVVEYDNRNGTSPEFYQLYKHIR